MRLAKPSKVNTQLVDYMRNWAQEQEENVFFVVISTDKWVLTAIICLTSHNNQIWAAVLRIKQSGELLD